MPMKVRTCLTRIVYSWHISIERAPAEVPQYMLGSRSAIDWILERHQIKTDKSSGIVNDSYEWSREQQQPRYIINLIGRIVTVSLESMRIVDNLSDLGLPST